MASKSSIREGLEFRKLALAEARNAYLALLKGGVKSYAFGGKNLTRLDLPQLENTIANLEKEISSLEGQLSGGGRRRAIGIVPRDW